MLFGVYLLIRKRAVLRYIFALRRFMLACWLTCGYFNIFQTIVNKKMTKNELFLPPLKSEMPAADSQMTTSFFMLQSWMLDSEE